MSKDEQMYVEKIYIYSGITTAGKELEEKQLNTSRTNSKKLLKKKKSEKEKNNEKIFVLHGIKLILKF